MAEVISTRVACAFSDFKKNAISWHLHLLHQPPNFVYRNQHPSAQLPKIHKIVPIDHFLKLYTITIPRNTQNSSNTQANSAQAKAHARADRLTADEHRATINRHTAGVVTTTSRSSSRNKKAKKKVTF